VTRRVQLSPGRLAFTDRSGDWAIGCFGRVTRQSEVITPTESSGGRTTRKLARHGFRKDGLRHPIEMS
jgi:hypothetical protein